MKMTTRLKLKCACCGFEDSFEDGEAAFEAGWDCPPHFSWVACPLCPAVCVVMGLSHEKAHAIWAREGRPDDFVFEKCATDLDLGVADSREKEKING